MKSLKSRRFEKMFLAALTLGALSFASGCKEQAGLSGSQSGSGQPQEKPTNKSPSTSSSKSTESSRSNAKNDAQASENQTEDSDVVQSQKDLVTDHSTASGTQPLATAVVGFGCKEWLAGDAGAVGKADVDGCQCSNMPLAAWTQSACAKTYTCCVETVISSVMTPSGDPRRECVCSAIDASACDQLANERAGRVVAGCPAAQ